MVSHCVNVKIREIPVIAIIIVHMGVVLSIQLVIFPMVSDGILVSRQGKQSQRATHLFAVTQILLTVAGNIEVGVEHFDQS